MKFVGKLLLDESSEGTLRRYVDSNSRLIVKPKNEFHSTVYYAEEFPIFESEGIVRKIREMLPVQLNPETFCFDVFEDYLVLTYSSEAVEEIKDVLVEEAVRQMITVWPNVENGDLAVLQASLPRRKTEIFNSPPHISLAYNFHSSETLPPFREPLTLVDFVYQTQ